MLLEDAKGETHLRNLSVLPVSTEQEAMRLLFLGDTNRSEGGMIGRKNLGIFQDHRGDPFERVLVQIALHFHDLRNDEREQNREDPEVQIEPGRSGRVGMFIK